MKAPSDYAKQSDKSIERGIASLRDRVSEHQRKIAEKLELTERLEGLERKRLDGLIKHWNKEITNYNEQIQSSLNELERRRNK